MATVLVVFAVIGFTATLVTLAGLLWVASGVLFRKPRVRLVFRRQDDVGDDPLLTCEFFNDQLVGGIFGLLNIKRHNVDEFWGLATVGREHEYKICDLDIALHDSHGRHGNIFPLPASSVQGLIWPMVCFDDVGACVMNDQRVRVYLQPGTYEIRVFVHADEADIRVIGHKFLVGVDATIFDWFGEQYQIRNDSLTRFIRKCRDWTRKAEGRW